MVFHCLKKKIKNEKIFNCNNYICFGLIFGALVLSLSDAKTEAIAIIEMIWTFIFLVMLFYAEKNDFK